jgi:predicted nucleic acid-binding protein
VGTGTVATSPNSGTSLAVLDASALLRSLVDDQHEANAWMTRVRQGELVAAWPSHLYAEVAHGFARLTRAGRIGRPQAEDAVEQIRWLPARVHPVRHAAREAFALALERGLSVYDALYVVLAEILDAPLVTADRRLADATEQAILLPG